MADLLKGLTAGGWAGLFAWITPCVVAVGVFVVLFHSHWSTPPTLVSDFNDLTFSEKTGTMLIMSAVMGFVMNSLSTPLYRLLEGYALPPPWRRWLADRQLAKKHRL